MRLSIVLVSSIAASCSRIEEPAAPVVAVLRQAASYPLTIPFSGGIAGSPGTPCPLCGGDYACTHVGNWGGGTRTFRDPAPPQSRVTGVSVIVTYGCASNPASVSLNGTLLGTISVTGSPYSCSCGQLSCMTRTFTINNPAGVPGYVYGGNNTIQLSYSGGPYFCVRNIMVEVRTLDAPMPTASPSLLDFGGQPIATTSNAQQVTLTNAGPVSLVLRSSSVSGPFNRTGPTNNTVLAPDGGSATYSVTFSPPTGGPHSGTLTIDTSVGELPINLTGDGSGGVLSLSPSPLPFSATAVGQSSTSVVTASNIGDGGLTITAVNGSGVFSALGLSLPLTLTPGSSADLMLTFTPMTRSSYIGTYTVNVPPLAMTQLQATGTGTGPDIAVVPPITVFPDTDLGASNVGQVLVQNVGESPLTVTDFSANIGMFVISGPAVPFILAPDAGQTLTVTFAPTTRGPHSGSPAVSSNAVAMPTRTFSLSGRGIAGALLASCPNFGSVYVGAPSTSPCNLQNVGERPLNVTGMTVSGAAAADYSGSSSLPMNLDAGALQTFSMRFAPTATGTRSAVANFLHTGFGSSSAPMSGTGISAVLALSPTALAFNAVQVGATASVGLVVRNTGTGALTISSLLLSGPDAARFSTGVVPLPFTVVPNGSVNLFISFAPAAVGAMSASLTIVSNDTAGGAMAVVPLSGAGAAEALEVGPAMVDFGTLSVGASSAVRTVVVRNVGSSPFNLTRLAFGQPDGGPFFLSPAPTLPRSVNSMTSLNLTVRATPPAVGQHTDVLTVLTSVVDGGVAQVSLQVLGTNDMLVPSVTDLDFGAVEVGASASASVELRNTTNSGVPITLIALTGAGAAQFSTATSAFTLPALGSRTHMVTFAPTQAGAAMAQVRFSFANGSATVGLAGLGVSGGLEANPAMLNFGAVEIGRSSSLVLSVRNASPSIVVIHHVTTQGPFGVTLSPASLDAGAQIPVSVTFSPVVEGASTGTLRLSTVPDGGGGLSVPLLGTGVTPGATDGGGTGGGSGTGGSAGAAGGTGGGSGIGGGDGTGNGPGQSGCGCRAPGISGAMLLLGALLSIRRRSGHPGKKAERLLPF